MTSRPLAVLYFISPLNSIYNVVHVAVVYAMRLSAQMQLLLCRRRNDIPPECMPSLQIKWFLWSPLPAPLIIDLSDLSSKAFTLTDLSALPCSRPDLGPAEGYLLR